MAIRDLSTLLLLTLVGQEKPQAQAVRRWLVDLGSEDPNTRSEARHRLIQHDCAKDVEPLRESSDADLRGLANEVVAIASFKERLKLHPLWMRERPILEALALAPPTEQFNVLSRLLRDRPEVFTADEQVALAGEILKHREALDAHWGAVFRNEGPLPPELWWFYRELVKEESLAYAGAQALVKLAPGFTPAQAMQVMATLLDHLDHQSRMLAVAVSAVMPKLASLDAVKAGDTLIERLGSSKPGVRVGACEALASVAERATVDQRVQAASVLKKRIAGDGLTLEEVLAFASLGAQLGDRDLMSALLSVVEKQMESQRDIETRIPGKLSYWTSNRGQLHKLREALKANLDRTGGR